MSLIWPTCLIETHDDDSLYMSVEVGFDEQKNFVVRFTHTDWDNSFDSYVTDYKINVDRAYDLSHAVGSHLVDLPEYFSQRFGERPYTAMAEYSEVRSTLYAVLSFIENKTGCRMTQHRKKD